MTVTTTTSFQSKEAIPTATIHLTLDEAEDISRARDRLAFVQYAMTLGKFLDNESADTGLCSIINDVLDVLDHLNAITTAASYQRVEGD